MSRPVDRLLGRDAPQTTSFGIRPFGTSAAEAEAQTAAAAAAIGAAAGPNMTTGFSLAAAKRASFGEPIQ